MKNIMEEVTNHFNESKQYFNENNIVGIFLHGSQNYGLATENSDIDTKLITTPTVKEICRNAKPASTTHVRANDEHIDFKDVRLMFDTFRKQNLNFLEILFTDYKIVNPLYEEEWNELIAANEIIARYNPYFAVKAMVGIAYNKQRLLTTESLSRAKTFSYDPKQLYQLIRISEYLTKYINGVPYKDCLKSNKVEYLKAIKEGICSKEEAIHLAKYHKEYIDNLVKPFTNNSEFNIINKEAEAVLQEVQEKIIKKSLRFELESKDND